MDEQIVQKEGAVSEGAVSVEGIKPAEELKTPEPLTEARVAQLIADGVKAKSAEIERHFQSVSDKRVGQAEYRAKQAETRHEAVMASYKTLNPAMADKLRLADLEAKARFDANLEEEEGKRQQLDAFDQSFNQDILQHIEALGVDPTDKRIDWATGARDYTEKWRKILASVATISREGLVKKKEDSAKEKETLVKEITAKVRKDLGYDSADTFVSSGGGSGELGSLLSGKNPGQARKELDKYIKGA